ncbi:hypothetical protein MVEN_00392000 [Mycena venus]|uniref:Uncharacterized protein n=1 Tax=Mycena venus TaxID=2733690 RepID=A0A8H6YU22_9AGAR|nr:hypothetical protein MVEN_00392000 [Mycena venus]
MTFFDAYKLVVVTWLAASGLKNAAAAAPQGGVSFGFPIPNPEKCIPTDGKKCPIAIGTPPNQKGTWVWTFDGVCDDHFLLDWNENPCNIPFTLGDQPGTFTLQGCGGSMWVNNEDGFFENCHPTTAEELAMAKNSTSPDCIAPGYVCGNDPTLGDIIG